jgi:hypothetical protein
VVQKRHPTSHQFRLCESAAWLHRKVHGQESRRVLLRAWRARQPETSHTDAPQNLCMEYASGA